MTPDEVRAIVREEVAAIDEAKKLTGDVEFTLTVANMKYQAEELLDKMQLPDLERELVRGYLNGLDP